MPLLDSSSPDEDGGQSIGENVWRLQSVDPYTSTVDKMAKYPTNARRMTEIHLDDDTSKPIY